MIAVSFASLSGEAWARSSQSVLRRVSRAIVLAPIRLYSKLISPALPRRCRYEPTCSAYALEAVRDYGVARGFVLAGWRLLRCNPFSDGGLDPVEAQRLFRSTPRSRVQAGGTER